MRLPSSPTFCKFSQIDVNSRSRSSPALLRLPTRSTSLRIEVDRVGHSEVRAPDADVQGREAAAKGGLLGRQHQRKRGDLDSARVDVDAKEVVLEDRGGDVARIRDRGLLGPAGLARMLDLVEIHAVKKPEGVLAEVHGPARRIEQCNVPGALKGHDLTSFAEQLVGDLLAGVGDQVVGNWVIGLALVRQRWRRLRCDRRIGVHLEPQSA